MYNPNNNPMASYSIGADYGKIRENAMQANSYNRLRIFYRHVTTTSSVLSLGFMSILSASSLIPDLNIISPV